MRYLLILIFCLHSIISGAQEFILPNSRVPFKTIKSSTGISSNIVYKCLQDNYGFIWMATQEGLNRFDGSKCFVIKRIAGNSNSLSSNDISDIQIDGIGNLWIATRGGGINYLNLKTYQFKHFFHNPKDPNSLISNEIRQVFVDEKNNLWAVSSNPNAINLLKNGSDKFIRFSKIENDTNSVLSDNIKKTISLKDNQVWIVSRLGLCLYNKEKSNFSRIALPDKDLNIKTGCTFDSKSILLFTNKGLYKFYIENHSFQKLDILKSLKINIENINLIKVDSRKNIWIGSKSDGLVFIKNSYKSFIHFTEDFTSESAIKKNDIRSIDEDREGNIWIGTYGGGVSYINSTFKSFNHFNYSSSSQNQLSHNIILSFSQYNNEEIIISTDGGGLFKFNKEKAIFYPFPKNDATRVVLSQVIDNQGNLWLGTYKYGLLKYNLKTNTFKQYTYFEQFGKSESPIFVMKIIKNKLWLGTNGQGVLVFNLDNEKYEKQFPFNKSVANGISNGHIRSFYFDGENTVWIGHYSGISFFNLKSLTFKHLYINTMDSSYMGSACAYSIFKDSKDNIWIGTGGQGLLQYDKTSGKYKFYNSDNDYNANQVFGIIEDKNSNIWTSTNSGLIKFSIKEHNPQNLSFTHFTEESGIQSNNFSPGAYFKDKSGILFFGGSNGFNAIFPELFEQDEKIANGIQLTDFKVFGISQIPGDSASCIKQPINFLKEIELDYALNNISISFVCPYYSGFGKIKYAYKMLGLDKQWTYDENNLSANYNQLPSGNYQFLIKASLNGTDWVEREPLKIKIIPPWWKIRKIQLIIVSILVLIFVSFYYVRINILQVQKVKLERMVKQRTDQISYKNVLLNEQKEEIESQKDILQKQKNELSYNYQVLKNTLSKLELSRNALIESEKMASLGTLTAGVAHEINNPLNFITLGIDNIKNILTEIHLQEKSFDETNYNELQVLIGYSETGIKRISGIVDSLRTYSRAGDNYPQLVKMSELVKSSLIILKSKMPAFIELHFDFTNEIMINCKSNQILQVLINIIDNAIFSILSKDQKSKEFINFILKEELIDEIKYLVLSIENSGPPIPDNMSKRIFDPFFTTKEPKQGTGLGLYISYNIIKDHKGFIELYNKEDRVVFRLLLPIHSDAG